MAFMYIFLALAVAAGIFLIAVASYDIRSLERLQELDGKAFDEMAKTIEQWRDEK